MSFVSSVSTAACGLLGAACIVNVAINIFVSAIRKFESRYDCDHGVFDTKPITDDDLIFDSSLEGCFTKQEQPITEKESDERFVERVTSLVKDELDKVIPPILTDGESYPPIVMSEHSPRFKRAVVVDKLSPDFDEQC